MMTFRTCPGMPTERSSKDLLLASPTPLTPEAIAATFARSSDKRLALITEICEALTSLGLATATEDAAFAA